MRQQKDLKEAIAEIEVKLGNEVNEVFKKIIPAFEKFGYPGLADPGLTAITNLDIERVLSNHTSIRYEGLAGVLLPESYSGLGSRNLILILLTLLGYYREYATRKDEPGLHLIFIEEPEAHLHPQMQEVFIKQLTTIAEVFPAIDGEDTAWSPQFIVSTHSPHIANRADFSAIRYFRVESQLDRTNHFHTTVLNLDLAEGIDSAFLHQYLTLVRCDLFFADKAILVEGASERLIIPAIIQNSHHPLGNQFITIMEVGGAYAFKFFPLLKFLGIPALIITDIDAVRIPAGGNRKVSTTVRSGTTTSNTTIARWFEETEELSLHKLLKDAETDAIVKRKMYLAYQVPEKPGEACGRTFEDAFILANADLFNLSLTKDYAKNEKLAFEESKRSPNKKSTFALRFAIDETDWNIPRYLKRGLDWLLSTNQRR